MANPNPEDPNVPNEDFPEEDPYHLLNYDDKEDPKMDIEEEEPEEDPVEEPKPIAGHGDQFDAHPNPQPGNINGWLDDDDDVEEEDDENEDVDIEEDDDAEIIFPYEEADDELEVEEACVEPEVEEAGVEPKLKEVGVEPEVKEVVMNLWPRGLMWSWRLRSQMVHRRPLLGLVPKGRLLRDLEALHRQERIREAESKTSRTEISLLGSKAKIGKIKREILHHDLNDDDDVEEEDEENKDADIEEDDDAEIIFPYEVQGDQTPPPRFESSDSDYEPEAKEADDEPEAEEADNELEVKEAGVEPEAEGADVELEAEEPDGVLEATIGTGFQRPFAARMRDIIRDQFATSMNEFMANMNSGAGGSGGDSGSGGAGRSGGNGGNADGTGVRGTGPTVPELTGCTYATFIKCDPLPFNGTKGAVDLCQWFERLESVFQISECKEKDRVKFLWLPSVDEH
nr:reverse transcriptase domain-containing protein [Tanacetum cinerariifolium]